jgi:DNA-directed RNA polymerase specialized sigma24 family protein
MLNGKLALHDIHDVEQFCGRIIDQSRRQLSPQDNEDLTAYLIETCWELSLQFEPGGITFSTYATTTLRRRVVDWQRNRDGRTVWQFADRTHIREIPTFHPLDDRPDTFDTSQPMDTEVGGLSDLIGVLGTRGSSVPRRDNGVGKAPTREAA